MKTLIKTDRRVISGDYVPRRSSPPRGFWKTGTSVARKSASSSRIPVPEGDGRGVSGRPSEPGPARPAGRIPWREAMMASRFLMLGVKHRLPAFLFLAVLTCAGRAGPAGLRVDTGVGQLDPRHRPGPGRLQSNLPGVRSDNRTVIYVRDSELGPTQTGCPRRDALCAGRARFCGTGGRHLQCAHRPKRRGKNRLPPHPAGGPKDPAEIHQAREQALSNPSLWELSSPATGSGRRFCFRCVRRRRTPCLSAGSKKPWSGCWRLPDPPSRRSFMWGRRDSARR